MGKRKSNLEDQRTHVYVIGGMFADALQNIAANDGTERDWRNSIPVPRPRTWAKRPDLVGKTVIPHTCNAKIHGDNDGCICEFIGEPVVVGKICKKQFGNASYHIKGSRKCIEEREFSDETRDKDPDVVEGFILEGPDGIFLTAGFVWMPAKKPINGYLHNTQVVRDLLTADFPNGRPIKAYPASSRLDGSEKEITGKAIPFDQLAL